MIKNIQDKKPRILVIGDLMIDKYLFGHCSRISPEAPVQIVDVKKETMLLGGAGNVVNNLQSLGAYVSVLSVIGDCHISSLLKKLLEEINVETKHLIREENRVSSQKTRIISSQQQVVRYDIESTNDINSSSEEALQNKYEELIDEFDLVILSDYGKGVLTDRLTKKLISLANLKNIKVIVDPKGFDYSKYSHSYLLTPNKKEAAQATGIEIKSSESIDKVLNKLKKDFKLSISMITLSEDGIAILDSKIRRHPTVAKEVFDVTGAGDTVIASLGYALACNLDIDNAVKFANLAAGVVVGKVGSATVNFDEIITYESSLHLSGCSDHIKTLEQFLPIVNKLKENNEKIIFTNGCFDILHVGHVKYLEEAKKLGGILVVGINSDESIKKLKGSSRPINNLEDRACVIAGLESVDYVIPFEEDTPLKLIKAILPNKLIKGSDYKGKKVVGEDIVDELILIDFIAGKSTSEIIKKIQISC